MVNTFEKHKRKGSFEKRKLKGSTTLEAAVIVPIFTIIVVQIVLNAFQCHDVAIRNCVTSKMCIKAEYGYRTFDKDNADKLKNLTEKTNAYIGEKTIGEETMVNISASLLDINAEKASVLRNDPVDYVWLTDAAEKLLKKGEHKNGK